MLYNWAIANPSSVACIAGIYPVVNIKTWPVNLEQWDEKQWSERVAFSEEFQAAAREHGLPSQEFVTHLSDVNPVEHLLPLANARIPILSIHGDKDVIVPYGPNSEDLTIKYNSLGGQAELVTVHGKGHVRADPEFFQSQRLVEFLIANTKSK